MPGVMVNVCLVFMHLVINEEKIDKIKENKEVFEGFLIEKMWVRMSWTGLWLLNAHFQATGGTSSQMCDKSCDVKIPIDS